RAAEIRRRTEPGRCRLFHQLRDPVRTPAMSMDLLSQDEIDALLHGVDSGAVDVEEAPPAPDEARDYDFASQDRIVRGRLPTLEMINERFARTWRIGL